MYEYNIILSNSDERTTREVELIEDHLGKQVDGLIFMSDSISDEVRAEMSTSSVPIVLAGTLDVEEELATVNIDFEEAAFVAVNKLIANGHKRIVFASGPFTRDINRISKKSGYIRALQAANLAVDEELIIEIENTYDGAYEGCKKILELEEKPTAIFTGSDVIAVGLLNGIRDSGLSVPRDYELICFEHSILPRVVRPQLTSIVVPLYDLGAVAMRLLTKLMNGEEIDDKHVILPFRLEERDSTK